ncbi:MAG: DUF5131 family protein [Burkholderiaceae bacterium]
MSDHTAIEWTDATWNVITGCSVVSAGCKNCYAMKLAGTRLQHHPSRAGLTQPSAAGPVWNGQVRFNMQWLEQPLGWKRPRQIFVCAHGDLFHEAVPDQWIADVFGVMHAAPWHTFQVLTKRAARMRALLSSPAFVDLVEESAALHTHAEVVLPLPNVWLGVSVEHQGAADERIPELLATPAAVRWISAEPLLGPIALWRVNYGGGFFVNVLLEQNTEDVIVQPALDWVVAGGESGRAARPMHPDWARSLRDQCAMAGVAFHFKQWGEWAPHDLGGEMRDGTAVLLHALGNPEGHFRRGDVFVERVGKRKAGRLLDGRTHDDYPKP